MNFEIEMHIMLDTSLVLVVSMDSIGRFYEWSLVCMIT